MPYTEEQYQRAKSAVSSGGIPPDKLAVVAQRIAEFEGKPKGMGNLKAMESAAGPLALPSEPEASPQPEMPSLAEVGAGQNEWLNQSQGDTAQVIRAAMPYEEMEARRQAVDTTRKLARDESLKTASKLKVFADPPHYTPPKPLPGMLGDVALTATNMPARYFEPTVDEFRTVIAGNGRVAQKVRSQYPDVAKLDELTEEDLAGSEAFKAYADARWQQELAKAIKAGRGVIRTAYSDEDWMSGFKPAKGPADTLATGMDLSMSTASGALQGASMGGWDAGLSAVGATDLRDAGRGSRSRHPVAATVGELGGALHPVSLGSKLAGGLGKLGAPTSLLGRTAKAGAIGAGSAVLEENVRAAADLAADAMDAEETVAETLTKLRQSLSFNPNTAMLGGGIGAGADLVGAGLGAGSRAMQEGNSLRVPLKDYERAGGEVGPFMGPKLTKDALELRNRAEGKGTEPAALVAEEVKQPLARQRLLEQEEMNRGVELATNRAQARLDGAESTFETSNKIKALSAEIPKTPVTNRIKKMLKEFATDLGRTKDIDAEQLDRFIEIADDQAGFAQQKGEPKKYWVDVSKMLRDLRDEFKFRDDATVVTEPPDKGLFTAEPDVTIKTPEPKQVGAVRDRYGNVKAVEDYSAEKLRQARIMSQHEQSNRRMGLPAELQAESALSDPYVSKGIFDPKTPQEVAESLPLNVKFKPEEDKAFVAAIRDASKRNNFRTRDELDDLASRSELETLGGRAGLNLAPKLRLVRELESAGELEKALGGTLQGVSSRGNFGFDVLKRAGFRSIPTLESLGSGLPDRALQLSDVKQAGSRLKEFLAQQPSAKPPVKDPVGPSHENVPAGDGKPIEVRQRKGKMIPKLPSAGLRGGLPTRAIGAAREDEQNTPEFTKEESDFWLQVLDNLAKGRTKEMPQ